jgi:8-oxo-dGTP pyrophosphatase MutT (NUDIX family)
MDLERPDPRYWKCPGGRSKSEETAKEAAVREVWEETGIILRPETLEILRKQRRNNHTFFFFKASISTLDGLKERGNEGEQVETFTSTQIAGMADFFPAHREIAQEASLL